jgi:hypothetical protein
MKVLLAAALAAATAAPVIAQDAHAGHADHAAPAAATGALTLDTPVEAIVADTKGKAVLEANLPGVTTHEHYEMFKSMSLKQIAGVAPDKLTPEVLAKVEADLAAIK